MASSILPNSTLENVRRDLIEISMQNRLLNRRVAFTGRVGRLAAPDTETGSGGLFGEAIPENALGKSARIPW